MNLSRTLPAALRATALAMAALALAPAAQAYTLSVLQANGNTVDSSFSTPEMLSLDIGLNNGGPITLQLTPGFGGELPMLNVNAIVRNYTGLGLQHLQIELTGGLFHSLGGAGGTFSTLAFVTGGGRSASIQFSGPEYFEATLGDWYLNGSPSDFVLDIANAHPGRPVTLSFTATVPEPGQWALMLAGLAGVAGVLRRAR